MVESYTRISGKQVEPDKPRKWGWVNPWLYLVLVILSSIDFAMIFHWTILEYKISIILDFLVWLLGIRYVSRAHWLKSKGKREKMKAFLDDSRSQFKSEDTESREELAPNVSWKPFLVLAILAGSASVVVSSFRWAAADRTFAINDLKACMVKCMSFSSESFYNNGELELALSRESCVQEKASDIDFNLFLSAGEIYLRGREKPSTDFFGNTILGDESLILDPAGRFRKSIAP